MQGLLYLLLSLCTFYKVLLGHLQFRCLCYLSVSYKKKPLGKADPSDFYIYYERIKSSSLPTALLAGDKDTTNFLNIQMLLDLFSHSLMSTANIR